MTNYPKILKHLNSAKSLSAYSPLEQHEDLITHILEEQTVSIEDSIYQRTLEQPQHTSMRNLIFKNLSEKSQWKKADLKKTITTFIVEMGGEPDEDALNKLISQYTATYGNIL